MKWTIALVALVLACATDPEPPIICGTVDAQEAYVGSSVSVTLCFEDPEGGTITLTAKTMDETVATASGGGSQVVVRALSPGETRVMVTAMDPDSLTAETSFEMVVPNRPPTVRAQIPSMSVTVGQAVRVSLEQYFEEPDGQVLRFSAAPEDSSVAGVEVTGDTLSVTGISEGETSVTVVASDPGGLTAEQDFQFEAIARGEERLRDNFDGDLKKWKVRGTGTTMELDDGWLNVEMGQSAWTNWAYRPLEDTIADVKLVTKARYQSGGGVDLGFKVTGEPRLLTFSFGKNIQRRDKENSYVDYSVHWWLGPRWFSHSDLYGTSSMVPSAGTDFEIAVSVIGKDIRVEIDGDELLEFDFADYSDDEIGEVEYFGLGVIPRFTEIFKTTKFDWVVLYK